MTETSVQIDIETLVQWSPVKLIRTKDGRKVRFRKASIDQNFWVVWRTRKEELKAHHVSVKKMDDGTWEVQQWTPMSKEEVDAANEAIELSRQSDADFNPPCPEGLDFLPYQKAGILYAMNSFGLSEAQLKKGGCPSCHGCLIGDEMGL